MKNVFSEMSVLGRKQLCFISICLIFEFTAVSTSTVSAGIDTTLPTPSITTAPSTTTTAPSTAITTTPSTTYAQQSLDHRSESITTSSIIVFFIAFLCGILVMGISAFIFIKFISDKRE